MILHEIVGYCPMCGKTSHVILTDDEFDKHMEYHMYRKALIQDVFPDMPKDVREFLSESESNRYCSDCQELLFQRKPSGKIKPGEDGLLDVIPDFDFKNVDEYDIIKKEADDLFTSVEDCGLMSKSDWESTERNWLEKVAESENFVAFRHKNAESA